MDELLNFAIKKANKSNNQSRIRTEKVGEVNYYLDINVEKANEWSYEVNKKIKIGEIVNTFNPKDPKPYNSPMDPGNLKLED